MKNLRVVVMTEQVSGPNEVMVVNINSCPTALAILNISMLNSTMGCRDINWMALRPSPVIRSPKNKIIQKLNLPIMRNKPY